MLDGRKLLIVARFELAEAIRSRLFIVAMVLFGAGASLGSFIFLKMTSAAEAAARDALASSLHVNASQLAPNLIREKALPMIASFIEDESIRQELLSMPLLSIFYGYVSLRIVGLLVLTISAGTMAADISTGATRFTLFRCDRLTWAAGKLLGQEVVLACGLAVGALLAGAVGVAVDSNFEAVTWLWLFRTSFRAWLYANAYLGLFSGLSLCVSTAMQARALSLFFLLIAGAVEGLVTSAFLNDRLPGIRYLAMALPSAHRDALWSPHYGNYLTAAFSLLLIGGIGFIAGQRVFAKRDA